MNITEIPNSELELMSNEDLTELMIKENKKPMNTPDIFKKICAIHGYTDEEYTAKIGEYYTSLTTDKRFILLETAEWDLRDNHAVKIEIDDSEEEIEEIEDEEIEEIDEIEEEEEENVIEETIDDEGELDIDDDVEDDIEDLAIVDEEDLDA